MSIEIKELSGYVYFYVLQFSCVKNMRERTTFLGTIGSWLGSIAAQVIALIIVFIYKRVSPYIPNLSLPPHPLEPPIRDLAEAVRANTRQGGDPSSSS